jgi:uncharacterized membrane protein
MQKSRKIEIATAAIGLLVSVYLVLYHYSSIPLLCSSSGVINCGYVLHSSYSYLFGVPVAVYGMVFFIAELLLIKRRNAEYQLMLNAIGVSFVAYFLYVEYVLGAICEYCTVVHAAVVLLFAISIIQVRDIGQAPKFVKRRRGSKA